MKLYFIKIFLILVLLLFLNFSYTFAKTLTFTDVYGRKVSLDVPVRRACLLATYELIPALKIRNQVVAVGKWAYDDPIMKATVPDLNNIPSPGVGGPGVNVELLKRLGTELIVTFRVPPEELNFLEAKGIKAFAIYPNSVKELMEVIKWHGVVFGKEREAERVIKEMEKVLRLIEERTSKIPFSKRKKVIWLHSDPTSVAGGNGIVNDTLLKIGGINSAAFLFPDSSIAKTSLETLIKLNPDVIFIWGASPFNPSDLISNPQWNYIKAVKEKKIYKLSALTTFSPRHIIDMLYMAMKLYPEQFQDIDFEEVADNFYKKVFGISYYKVKHYEGY